MRNRSIDSKCPPHFDATDVFHAHAGELLRAAADEPLGASAVTVAEVLVGPARVGRLDRATAALAQLQVARIGLNEEAPERLAVLRAATRLKLPDCCVLLAAEQASNGSVATFDDRLAAAARDRGLAVLGR